MAVTPVELRNFEFPKTFRGFDPEEVETIIAEAAGEMERLLKENEELKQKSASLQEQLKKYSDLEESIKKTLLTAENAVAEKQKAADKSMEVQIRETEAACNEMRQKALKEVETIKYELASLKMQKVRFMAEIRSLIDSHTRLLEERGSQVETSENQSHREFIERGTENP
jgi:cell division initiation protein